MTTGVLCIATTELQATTIVEQLRTAGFPHYDISVLFSDKTGTRDFVPPEYGAKRYEREIKNGNRLIFVHARDRTERDIAKAIFAHAGAADIAYAEEAAVAKQELAWKTRAVGPLPAPPAASGMSLPFSLLSSQRTWRVPGRHTEEGTIGWILLWALGIPIPILVVLFLLRGCT
jgi:hypothetical protein